MTNVFEAHLKQYIRIYDLGLPDEMLQSIITEYDPKMDPAYVGAGFKPDYRKCFTYRMHLHDRYDTDISNAIAPILDDYCATFEIGVTKDTGYNILKYETGFYYKQHVDHNNIHPDPELKRYLSSVILLNDNFQGGELSFFNGQYDVPLKKNQMVIFPSNFVYCHQVKPVRQGVRYSLVTWFM